MNTIYVGQVATSGDGSFQYPFNDFNLAIKSYTKDTDIVLLDGTYSINGELDGHSNVSVKSYTSGGATVQISDATSIKSADISFEDIELIIVPNKELKIIQSLVKLVECLVQLPATSGDSVSVASGTLYMADCTVSGTLTPDSAGVFIHTTSQSRLVITDCTFDTTPLNYTLIHASGDTSSLTVTNSKFKNSRFKGTSLTTTSCILIDTNNSSRAMSVLIKGNTFDNIHRALVVAKIGSHDIPFLTSVDGATMDSMVVTKNYFTNCYVVLKSASKSNIDFFNNTVYKCNFAFIVERSVLRVQNTIISECIEPSETDASLGIAVPYETLLTNVTLGGQIHISYSCLYNNALGEIKALNRDGVIKGPVLRYVDPLFVSPDTGDFSLATNSVLIDSGIGVTSNYSGITSDIGAYEFSVASVTNTMSDYLKRMREQRDKLPGPQTNIRNYIETRLKEEYPTIDTGAGSVINDLLIKPLVAILTPIQSEIEYLKKKTSLAYADSLSEGDMDDLAANFFIERRRSSKAYGVVRIYYYFPVDIKIASGTTFSTATGLTVTTTKDFEFSSWELVINKDESTGFYYVDIAVESPSSNGTIEPNKIVKSGLDNEKGIAKITNPNYISSGTKNETNSELLERIRKSITTRNLVNNSSIETVLKENFKNVEHTLSIGFNDPEMERDVVEGFSKQHFGGCVDTYVKPNILEEFTTTHTIPVSGDTSEMFVLLSASNIVGSPILYIKRIFTKDPSGIELDAISPEDYSIECRDKSLRFSPYEELMVYFRDASLAGASIGIQFVGAPLIKEINNYIRDNSHRVLCSDHMTKVFKPYLVSISGAFTGSASKSDAVINAVADYISGLTPGGILNINDIYTVAYNAGGLIDMSTLKVQTTTINTGSSTSSVTVTSQLQIPRTAMFVLRNNDLQYMGDK